MFTLCYSFLTNITVGAQTRVRGGAIMLCAGCQVCAPSTGVDLVTFLEGFYIGGELLLKDMPEKSLAKPSNPLQSATFARRFAVCNHVVF